MRGHGRDRSNVAFGTTLAPFGTYKDRRSWVNLNGVFTRFSDANRCFAFPGSACLRDLVELQFFKIPGPDQIRGEITCFIWLH